MRVVVAAIGSRGDVAPCAHFADRLAAAGHEVVLLTHAAYADAASASVLVVSVDSDPEVLMAGPAAHALRRADVRALNRTRDLFADFVHAAHDPVLPLLSDADVLVATTFALAPVDAALRRGVPVVRAHLWPEYAGPQDPLALVPYAGRLPAPARRAVRRALDQVGRHLGGFEGWWERGRLHVVPRHPVTLTANTLGSLYAFSPALLASPPPEGVVTGWWTAHARGTISEGTARALAGGDAWIHVGFGSMHQKDPDALLDLVSHACRRAGVRAIVQLGERRGSSHPNLMCVGEEPHADLLPRVALSVHHGGAGTTGSVVRAGIPSVVVPHFADQFHWGSRLRALGVAARPLARPFLTADRLATRLADALAPAMARRAADLARRVAGEDGTGRAVVQLEAWVSGSGPA